MQDALDQLFTQRADAIFLVAAVILIPWLLALVYRQYWSATVKSIGAVAVCFAVALVWLIFHEFSATKWAIYAAVLIGATQLFYFAFRSGLRQFEQKTS